jgi:hypothetical protein
MVIGIWQLIKILTKNRKNSSRELAAKYIFDNNITNNMRNNLSGYKILVCSGKNCLRICGYMTMVIVMEIYDEVWKDIQRIY